MANLIKIWKDRGKILEGIKNNIFRKQHVEHIAAIRQDICNLCEFLDTAGTKCVMTGTQPCCGECGCSLALKTRSLSSECPKGFWKAELTPEEEAELNKRIRK
jgi:hypothetical protein